MSRFRVGLCLTLLIASTAAVEAGSRKHRGCGAPAYSCAAPLSCAAPANCAMPSCAAPMNYGCATPSCAAPLSCAAPVTCAAPLNCAGPAYAGSPFSTNYGGPMLNYGAGNFDPYGVGAHGFRGVGSFGGGAMPISYPTRGITPTVIPGDELVW